MSRELSTYEAMGGTYTEVDGGPLSRFSTN